MAKRKLDAGESSDSQNADKKHKTDNEMKFNSGDFGGFGGFRPSPLFGFESIKLIDFTNVNDRKEFHPDVDIISEDLTVLKYHKCKMVGYEFFKHIINEQNMCKIELKLYDSNTINMMLNYIEMGYSFNLPRNLNTKQIINLYSLAHYCNLKSLRDICCLFIETNIQVDKQIFDCYAKYKIKNNALFGAVLSGRFAPGTKFTQDFLNECFEFGMKYFQEDRVIINLLEIYCPTDEQMKLFIMGGKGHTEVKNAISGSFGGGFSPFGSSSNSSEHPKEKNRYDRFMNGKVSKGVIDTFFAKYNKDNNSPGVSKLMRLFAWMCFID